MALKNCANRADPLVIGDTALVIRSKVQDERVKADVSYDKAEDKDGDPHVSLCSITELNLLVQIGHLFVIRLAQLAVVSIAEKLSLVAIDLIDAARDAPPNEDEEAVR